MCVENTSTNCLCCVQFLKIIEPLLNYQCKLKQNKIRQSTRIKKKPKRFHEEFNYY